MKIMYFKNDNCSVCRAVLPKIEIIAKEYNINFEIIDVVTNPEIAGQMLVFTVPTLIFIDQGVELKRFSRNFGILEIKNFIECKW
ncbi:thioredoxin family protein [Thermosipho ferrireducens]|uniref:Thioredoxin family protein n=1 Tax=Thermosipho ferrireducens TaxID=2571116 RepID=A0ABX7S8V2_9BACT|nr:thioredoxin family protein [Thermosipho ferrireducens]QTA37560.1 thioredoxin family protein [Thermosipho ferrireducens]